MQPEVSIPEANRRAATGDLTLVHRGSTGHGTRSLSSQRGPSWEAHAILPDSQAPGSTYFLARGHLAAALAGHGELGADLMVCLGEKGERWGHWATSMPDQAWRRQPRGRGSPRPDLRGGLGHWGGLRYQHPFQRAALLHSQPAPRGPAQPHSGHRGPGHLHVGPAAGGPAVLAAEAPLRALLLLVALLLAEADQAFACRALGQQERAEAFVAALATEGAKRPEPHRPADAPSCGARSIHPAQAPRTDTPRHLCSGQRSGPTPTGGTPPRRQGRPSLPDHRAEALLRGAIRGPGALARERGARPRRRRVQKGRSRATAGDTGTKVAGCQAARTGQRVTRAKGCEKGPRGQSERALGSPAPSLCTPSQEPALGSWRCW